MATKTDSSFEGMRVTLLDGSKDRIAKVMKTGYKTKGGHTIKAANIAKKGRGLIETDAGGGGATPKASASKTSRRGSSSKKSSGSKSSSSKKSSSKDPSSMTRRELVTELVNAEVLPTRSAAKGTGVDELREMVVEAQSGSSSKKSKASKSSSGSGKVSRRRGKKAEGSAKPKKEKRSPEKRERKSDRKVSKSKPIKVFNDKIARDLESHVEAHIADFLQECTGYITTVACVGGVFNDERLTLQIGLLPANASDEEIEAYAADMEEAEETETGGTASEDDEDDLDEADGDVDMDELVEQLVDITGQDENKVRKAIEAYFSNYDDVIEPKLGDEVQIGTRLDYEGQEAIVIGFSESKGKMILYVEEEDKMKLVPIVKVAGMEIIESEEDEEEDIDEEPLDMDEEDEEEFDDEDEEALDPDEEEDDEDDEEDDDDEDEDEDSDDDDFDDFDDEL